MKAGFANSFVVMTMAQPPLKQRQIKTGPPTAPGAAPRLPHERDESFDSQDIGEPREDIQQAFEDLENGLVDTDLRGVLGVDEATRARFNQTEPSPPDPARTRDPNAEKLPDGRPKEKK
ncbi:hypothetical protein EDC30_104215 [Paucimonas lemoignei]|uniref:Uncharacterized protein n=2 Tax=Paucimonas lemoignei TaxID=29443 RepID=A0A4R3HW87_PAULE|nr:hypothetical protein EDC30_104215 [Paucimonas lemoignei]